MKRLNNRIRIVLLGAISIWVLSGCQTKPDMYYWGQYEGLIYNMYIKAGTAEPDVQIEKLTTDIQNAKRSGRKTPPGVHAHLGFMYAAAGNVDMAVDAFRQEKILFPESAQFIDGMMKRAFKGTKS